MVCPLVVETRILPNFLITADAILNSTLNIPLRGAAIGNGWIDPKVQYPAYLDYVTKTGLFEENSAVSYNYSCSSGFKSPYFYF
jgi:carboxypeptidase C (cathepsin A)